MCNQAQGRRKRPRGSNATYRKHTIHHSRRIRQVFLSEEKKKICIFWAKVEAPFSFVINLSRCTHTRTEEREREKRELPSKRQMQKIDRD